MMVDNGEKSPEEMCEEVRELEIVEDLDSLLTFLKSTANPSQPVSNDDSTNKKEKGPMKSHKEAFQKLAMGGALTASREGGKKRGREEESGTLSAPPSSMSSPDQGLAPPPKFHYRGIFRWPQIKPICDTELFKRGAACSPACRDESEECN
ncbi:hypothetical protein TrLO_g689 [Triparma laevis f. longispina]|uniref:Uncharacterized protein n=1 Tax=Triparma laevis f. longispina TaxID=1714387 RepID=A0A9W7FQW0_9STRA|nr:hypothetical protein TrLO_g689 [Triparma laevis f. longispina]